MLTLAVDMDLNAVSLFKPTIPVRMQRYGTRRGVVVAVGVELEADGIRLQMWCCAPSELQLSHYRKEPGPERRDVSRFPSLVPRW